MALSENQRAVFFFGLETGGSCFKWNMSRLLFSRSMQNEGLDNPMASHDNSGRLTRHFNSSFLLTDPRTWNLKKRSLLRWRAILAQAKRLPQNSSARNSDSSCSTSP